MTKAVAIGIFLLSLTSWPITIILSKLNILKSERTTILGGITYIGVVLVAIFLLFRRYFRKVDPLMYAFSLFCLDAACSFGTALELDGYISFQKLSNISSVEPYLQTAHGTMITYWNGTAHFILCIAAIALYTNRDSHREVSLYWAGSLLNSMVVLLPAIVTGDNEVTIPTLFNLIYLVLPLIVLLYYIDKRPIQARTFLKSKPIWKRLIDLLFLAYYLSAIGLAVFRGLTVLGGRISRTNYLDVYEPYLKDSSHFPRFQAITYEYVFVVYYLVAAYGLINPGQHWMADWSLVHAGAAAQAQFSYISGSLHRLTSKANHSPKSGTAAIVFWTINLVLFVVPHLFAWRCQRDPENFGRTYTVDLATPVQTYTLSSSRRPVKTSKAE
uniref:EXPERA domain-containing protein n=1 Tax=Arion vulgaris TaxID=1028688 RepID=A0A0B7AHF0_9EUPU